MSLRQVMKQNGYGYFSNTLKERQEPRKDNRSPRPKTYVRSYINELKRYGNTYVPNSQSLINEIKYHFPKAKVSQYNENTIEVYLEDFDR